MLLTLGDVMGVFLQSCAYFTRHLLYLYLWHVVLLVPKKILLPSQYEAKLPRCLSQGWARHGCTRARCHLGWARTLPTRPGVPLLPAGVSCPASPCGAVLSTSLQFCLKRCMFRTSLVPLQALFLSDTRNYEPVAYHETLSLESVATPWQAWLQRNLNDFRYCLGQEKLFIENSFGWP